MPDADFFRNGAADCRRDGAQAVTLLPLQGFVNAYAGITLPNPASVSLHEKMGFEPVGTYRSVGFKCGAWHDVAWYQRALQPRPDEPNPPLGIEETSRAAWNPIQGPIP